MHHTENPIKQAIISNNFRITDMEYGYEQFHGSKAFVLELYKDILWHLEPHTSTVFDQSKPSHNNNSPRRSDFQYASFFFSCCCHNEFSHVILLKEILICMSVFGKEAP